MGESSDVVCPRQKEAAKSSKEKIKSEVRLFMELEFGTSNNVDFSSCLVQQ